MKNIYENKFNQKVIYDVGAHKGEDTLYYLKKGFKVIAFEADPELISDLKKKFALYIHRKKLILIEGAITNMESDANGKIPFYRNSQDTVWGTTKIDWMNRNEVNGSKHSKILVNKINFSEILKKYGIPYYMKIDIEGEDLLCLTSLNRFNIKPKYISIESEKVSFTNLRNEFHLLNDLGYKKFNIVNQAKISQAKENKNDTEGIFLNYNFQDGSSGPFGKDLNNIWLSKFSATLKYTLIFVNYKIWGDKSKIKNFLVMKYLKKFLIFFLGYRPPGWYDTHARL